ncbi:MAG: dATP/dGTP diphosphohydrolase domain-containing protein [Rhodospirillaceae bacterium]
MRRTSQRKSNKKKPGQSAGLLVSGTKDTNPKDAIGLTKSPLSTVSAAVVMEMGLGMLEGALKYGRHNYRVAGVRSSVYYDAAMRHLMAWWEGEDIDPESGLHHVTKALSCLSVIRDAQLQGKEFDDRPPKTRFKMVARMNGKAREILARYPEPVAPYTQRPRKKAA